MIVEMIIYSLLGGLGIDPNRFQIIQQKDLAVCMQQADIINKTGKALAVCKSKE
jgi:hypothetical protein